MKRPFVEDETFHSTTRHRVVLFGGRSRALWRLAETFADEPSIEFRWARPELFGAARLCFYHRVPAVHPTQLMSPPPRDVTCYPGDLDDLEGMIAFVNVEAGTTVGEPWRARRDARAHAARAAPVDSVAEVDGVPSEEAFLARWAVPSRPAIFRGAAEAFPALRDWTPDRLRARLAGALVGVKIAPGGVFEGVESIDRWPRTSDPPQEVLRRLVVRDRVTVRPHHWETPFEVFLDRMRAPRSSRASFYLEYCSLDRLGDLAADVPRLAASSRLKLARANAWIGDGATRGKLHFDPYENLLTQVDGSRTLVLFPPRTVGMYEGHIREATLAYDFERDAFRRARLEESTSMVMSPVDIQAPDVERFPLYDPSRALRCRIDPGDVLYLPAFWWHEVCAMPSSRAERRWNVAVNRWFHPVWTKRYPDADAPLRLNWGRYPSLLRTVAM